MLEEIEKPTILISKRKSNRTEILKLQKLYDRSQNSMRMTDTSFKILNHIDNQELKEIEEIEGSTDFDLSDLKDKEISYIEKNLSKQSYNLKLISELELELDSLKKLGKSDKEKLLLLSNFSKILERHLEQSREELKHFLA